MVQELTNLLKKSKLLDDFSIEHLKELGMFGKYKDIEPLTEISEDEIFVAEMNDLQKRLYSEYSFCRNKKVALELKSSAIFFEKDFEKERQKLGEEMVEISIILQTVYALLRYTILKRKMTEPQKNTGFALRKGFKIVETKNEMSDDFFCATFRPIY